jgi:hypothetical protein
VLPLCATLRLSDYESWTGENFIFDLSSHVECSLGDAKLNKQIANIIGCKNNCAAIIYFDCRLVTHQSTVLMMIDPSNDPCVRWKDMLVRLVTFSDQ